MRVPLLRPRRPVAVPGRSALVLPAVFLLLMAAFASAGDPPFLYSLSAKGRVNIKSTPIERLPALKGLVRFSDLVVDQGVRYALRVDGTLFMDGSAAFTNGGLPLDEGGDFAAWIRLQSSDEGLYALQTGGRVTLDGALVRRLPTEKIIPEDPDALTPAFEPTFQETTIPAFVPFQQTLGPTIEEFLFVDMLLTFERLYVLRLDGALFDALTGAFLGNFEAGPGVLGDEDGTTADTFWVRLVEDPISGELLALRADGKLVRVDPDDLVPALDLLPEPVQELIEEVELALEEAQDAVEVFEILQAFDAILQLFGINPFLDLIENPVLIGVEVGALEACLPADVDSVIDRGNIYVDLETDEGLVATPVDDVDGDDEPTESTWWVLRRDGSTFASTSTNVSMPVLIAGGGTSQFVGNPFTQPLLGVVSLGNPFVDLLPVRKDSVEPEPPALWRLRARGQLHYEQERIVTLLDDRYERLVSDDFEPDLTGVINYRPVVSRYAVRVTEGEDVVVPILVSDISQPRSELTLEFDLENLPGATFDSEADAVLWPAGAEPGRYTFRMWVDDGVSKNPVRRTYRVTVLEPEDDPDRNRAPQPSKIERVQALVDHELSVPILATDRNGDALTITPEEGGVFERGATFDAATNTLHWQPGCLDLGARQARFRISDGTKTSKLRVRIVVAFPLFWEEPPES